MEWMLVHCFDDVSVFTGNIVEYGLLPCWLTLLLGLQVFECLQHREMNVTVLSDSSVAEYKAADYLRCSSAPFLRSLYSSTFRGQPVCPSLEQPNIITGLPAAGNNVTCQNFSNTCAKTCFVICSLLFFFLSNEPLWGTPHFCSCLPVLQRCRWCRLCDHGDIQARTIQTWRIHSGEQLLISEKPLERLVWPWGRCLSLSNCIESMYRIGDLRLSDIEDVTMYFQAFAKMAQKMLMKQVVVASLCM